VVLAASVAGARVFTATSSYGLVYMYDAILQASGFRVPVVMVTTEAEKSRVLQAIQAGVSDYLIKPFTSETLRQKVEKLCGAAMQA